MWCHHCGSSHRCHWISYLYFMGLVVFRLTSRTFFRRYHKRKVFLRCVFWCAWSGDRCDWRCACRCDTGTASDLKSDKDSGLTHIGLWVSVTRLGKILHLSWIFLPRANFFWRSLFTFGRILEQNLIYFGEFSPKLFLPLGKFFRDLGHF